MRRFRDHATLSVSGIVLARRRVAAADSWLLKRAVARHSPTADHLFGTASRVSTRSRIWLVVAAVLAGAGGHDGRRAAARGLLGIGLTSATVNGPLKAILRRQRPAAELRHRRTRPVVMPTSFSFPSGHSASAFAFATGVALEMPAAGIAVLGAATVVAYSRVHNGVHFPGDVIAGAGLGMLAALAAGRVLRNGHELTLPVPDRDTLPQEAVLLTSPDAGSSALLGRAKQALRSSGVRLIAEVPITQRERLAEWVDRPRSERPMIVAAGGDGTVGAAADYVAGTGALLGILPLGTSNDVARSLGIPLDPRGAARTLVDGVVRTIDAGLLVVPGQRPRHFVHAATVGLNVRFAELATNSSLRRRFGRFTYAVAAMRSLRNNRPFECELDYDGHLEKLTLAQLSIINAPVFGGSLDMRVPGARVDDRMLVVIAIEQESVGRLLLGAALTVAGSTRHVGGVHALVVRNLRVHVDQPLDVALDGEITATLPADFEIAPDALRVVTPAEPDL
jgi:YegS/Rv2252/BmrU family lipid kinase